MCVVWFVLKRDLFFFLIPWLCEHLFKLLLSSLTWCIPTSDLHLQTWLQCGETCDKLVCLLRAWGLWAVLCHACIMCESSCAVACRAVGGSWCGDWIVCRRMSKMKTKWQLQRAMCKENKVYVLLENKRLVTMAFVLQLYSNTNTKKAQLLGPVWDCHLILYLIYIIRSNNENVTGSKEKYCIEGLNSE